MKNIQDVGTRIIRELETTLSGVADDQAQDIIRMILKARRIFVAGAGRSGLMVKAFAMRLIHLGCTAYVVGETTTPKLTPEDMLLIASGSGATASLVVMAQKATTIGAQIGLIAINRQSPIAEIADIVLTISAPSPKIQKETGFTSIQPMGSLFEQSLLLLLDALIFMLMERLSMTSDNMFTRHANLE